MLMPDGTFLCSLRYYICLIRKNEKSNTVTFSKRQIESTMKNIIKLLLIGSICFSYLNTYAQVGINEDGSQPNASALLDVKSTTKGILIPRMTTTQRTNISSPATGLMVFDSTTNSFWFYNGAAWTEIKTGAVTSLQDTDTDTKIQVEESADEDKIRFDLGGSERLVIGQNASGSTLIELLNNNNNVFLGQYAGGNNTTGEANTFIGEYAGGNNTTGQFNTFIGEDAGGANTTGLNNTSLGASSASNLTTGEGNTFIGFHTGRVNNGNSNSFFGRDAGYSNLGNNNTFLGYRAGYNNQSSNNIFLGSQAGENETGSGKLYIENSNSTTPLIYGDFTNDIVKINGRLSITNGFSDADNDTKIQVEESADEDIIRFDMKGTEFMKLNNGRIEILNTGRSVIIGEYAGENDDYTNNKNVFVGYDAGNANTTGRNNVFNGYEAGEKNIDGFENIAIGYISLQNNTSGDQNTAVGAATLTNNTGNYNTALGHAALFLNTSGNNNTTIGRYSMFNNLIGSNNTSLGYGAGESATGSGNIFLGYQSGQNETGNNKLYIDNSNSNMPLIYGEFDNNIVTINGTFATTGIIFPNAGIHLPSAYTPDANYIGTVGNYISFAHSGVSEDFIGYKNNTFYFRDSPNGGDNTQPSVYAAAFPTYSSRRWKHNIKNLDNALSIIQQLQGVTYTWNEDHGGADDFGFIAEEVNEILPEIAPKNTEGEVDGVEYGQLTPYLVEAIKEQQAIIENQNQKIQQLEQQVKKIGKLETMLKQLQMQFSVKK
jgi:hypothetical protein